MEKLYTFIGIRVIEAESEEEARDLLADNSCDFAAKAECNEACQRCLGVLGGRDLGCKCHPQPASPQDTTD